MSDKPKTFAEIKKQYYTRSGWSIDESQAATIFWNAAIKSKEFELDAANAKIAELELKAAENDKKIRKLNIANTQLIYAIEQKGSDHKLCEGRHQTDYNGQATWCLKCGAKWSTREICEIFKKETIEREGLCNTTKNQTA